MTPEKAVKRNMNYKLIKKICYFALTLQSKIMTEIIFDGTLRPDSDAVLHELNQIL